MGKKKHLLYRRCSFVATTNEPAFLQDESGNTRWICFELKDVKRDCNKFITNQMEFNIDSAWAQAYYLYKTGFDAELTQEEIVQNEIRNNRFKLAKD